MKKTTSQYIMTKRSSIHNNGIFARKDIPKGTRIIEYVGEKITRAESDRRSTPQYEKSQKSGKYGAVYFFEINKRYDIDGNVNYNTARYINHSCNPNCETDVIRGRVWIIALRDIKRGEELHYDYGYQFDKDFEDHECRCGQDNCVGYIIAEEYWGKLTRALKKKGLLY